MRKIAVFGLGMLAGVGGMIFVGGKIFGGIINSIADSDVLFPDIIVPSIKDSIYRAMYGGDPPKRRREKVTYYTPSYTTYKYRPETQIPIRYEFVTKKDAIGVLNRLKDIAYEYNTVTIQDFNDHVGYPSKKEDAHKGWTMSDLNLATIDETYRGFELTMPQWRCLDE